jgi:hypothetical protein
MAGKDRYQTEYLCKLKQGNEAVQVQMNLKLFEKGIGGGAMDGEHCPVAGEGKWSACPWCNVTKR